MKSPCLKKQRAEIKSLGKLDFTHKDENQGLPFKSLKFKCKNTKFYVMLLIMKCYVINKMFSLKSCLAIIGKARDIFADFVYF